MDTQKSLGSNFWKRSLPTPRIVCLSVRPSTRLYTSILLVIHCGPRMTLLPSVFLSLFPSNAASMPESPPIEEVHRSEPHMLSSDDEPETRGQSGSEPLVTGPTIHHCNIGMVVIEHQQCHLLHNQLSVSYTHLTLPTILLV